MGQLNAMMGMAPSMGPVGPEQQFFDAAARAGMPYEQAVMQWRQMQMAPSMQAPPAQPFAMPPQGPMAPPTMPQGPPAPPPQPPPNPGYNVPATLFGGTEVMPGGLPANRAGDFPEGNALLAASQAAIAQRAVEEEALQNLSAGLAAARVPASTPQQVHVGNLSDYIGQTQQAFAAAREGRPVGGLMDLPGIYTPETELAKERLPLELRDDLTSARTASFTDLSKDISQGGLVDKAARVARSEEAMARQEARRTSKAGRQELVMARAREESPSETRVAKGTPTAADLALLGGPEAAALHPDIMDQQGQLAAQKMAHDLEVAKLQMVTSGVAAGGDAAALRAGVGLEGTLPQLADEDLKALAESLPGNAEAFQAEVEKVTGDKLFALKAKVKYYPEPPRTFDEKLKDFLKADPVIQAILGEGILGPPPPRIGQSDAGSSVPPPSVSPVKPAKKTLRGALGHLPIPGLQ